MRNGLTQIGLMAFLALAAVLPLQAAAPSSDAALSVKRFTGALKITPPSGKSYVVTPGERVPALPAGTVISVISTLASPTGMAEITAGGTSVFLLTRQSIRVTRDAGTGAYTFAAAGDTAGQIKLRVGNTAVILGRSAEVRVSTVAGGQREITAAKGESRLVTYGEAMSLTEGETAVFSLQQTDDMSTVDEASDVIPEPGLPETIEASPSAL